MTRDRRRALLDAQQTALNGIDYVEVRNAAQTQLRVHFLRKTPDVQPHISGATITGGDRIPTVAAVLGAWSRPTDPGHWVDVTVAEPGDFSMYELGLVARDPTAPPILDRYFDRARFSFKAECPSTLDCEPPPHECPPVDREGPQIDYLAKDFDSFRRALLEMSAQRYPAWQERSEADFGVMFAEALAALGDDLSYLQDRIAAEGWIETATERRSLVRLARLVDYEPRVATAAHALLQFRMEAAGMIPAGTVVSALAPDGELVEFETGGELARPVATAVDPAWNELKPWYFDDADRCLARGATEMWIERPARPLVANQLLVIETAGLSDADPPVRQLVRLDHAIDETDALYGQRLCHLVWRTEDALRVDRDLDHTRVHGNLVPATHGKRVVERFVAGTAPSVPRGTPRALIRTGANDTLQYLYSLRAAALAYLTQDDPDEAPRPELVLAEVSGGRDTWTWRRTLLGARPDEKVFTIDPVRFRPLDAAGMHADYDGAGDTLRFGDGSHGALPDDGMVFEVTYRAGGGVRGNVASGALTRIDSGLRATLAIASVTNPFPAEGGRDAEPDAQIRERAPQKFRASPLRVVRTEDYERAAESLAWVQRAGTRLRYTGSWLSVFTSVDPRGGETLSDRHALELARLLGRRRLAGYESFVQPPRYASLDLDIKICAQPDAFRSDVERGVLAALSVAGGFFDPDRFTFGAPLERSALEAAIQQVHGVDGVVSVSYRRRGHTAGAVAMPDAVEVGADEIVRVDNDPDHPERGSLRLEIAGGK